MKRSSSRRAGAPAAHASVPRARRGQPAARASAIVLAVIVLAGIALHAGGLTAPFFADDYSWLDHVRGRSLGQAVLRMTPIGPFVRPWSAVATVWGLSRLLGESPFWFHAQNLVLFAVILVLVFALGRRIAGARAAAIATGILALHYAPEAAVRWVSGSQDLWATAGALATLVLHLGGRRRWAAGALLIALFSKETAVVTLVIAVMLDRREGESWRPPLSRARWLCVATLAWAAVWIPVFFANARNHPGYVSHQLDGLPAAWLHLVLVFFGLEGTLKTPLDPGWFDPVRVLVMAIVIAVLVFAFADVRQDPDAARVRQAVRRAGLWALLAAAPVALVAPVWSAYQYFLALCGGVIGLGAILARVHRAWLACVLVALALLSLRGWGLAEMGSTRGAWKPLSRINGYYLRRGETQSARYLRELRTVRPAFPPRSTVFFTGLPPFVGWQSGNGAILRWAYADTTLRSFFLSDFSTERASRGPVFFFTAQRGGMSEVAGPSRYRKVGGGLILNDKPEAARDVLARGLAEQPADTTARYYQAWIALANGDEEGARTALARIGLVAATGPIARRQEIERRISEKDYESARRMLLEEVEGHELDPEAHVLLAELLHLTPGGDEPAIIEAFAARVLEPGNPDAWRRWGLIQAGTGRPAQAVRSLEHARELRRGPPDPIVERALGLLRAAPGASDR